MYQGLRFEVLDTAIGLMCGSPFRLTRARYIRLYIIIVAVPETRRFVAVALYPPPPLPRPARPRRTGPRCPPRGTPTTRHTEAAVLRL